MTLFAVDIEETHGTSLELRDLDTKFGQPFLYETAHLACLRDAAQVAFHVGHETGNACLAEGFCHDLQRDGLAGTRGSRYQSVAVGHLAYDA